MAEKTKPETFSTEDPYDKAWKYLAKQNIVQLFQVCEVIYL